MEGECIRFQLAIRGFKIGIWRTLLPAQLAGYLRGKCMLHACYLHRACMVHAWFMHGGVGLALGVLVGYLWGVHPFWW
jgi:hypothetical protein